MVVVCLTVILDVWHTIASSASYTATTKQDWETGTLTNIDYDSIPGDIKIGQSGNHSARNWKTPPDTFGVGSAFVSSGDYIYALRGNYENDFFRYNSINNSWEQLADAPTSAANNSSLAVASNGDIYAVFGCDTRTFAKYTPSQNTWTNLSDTPSRTGSGTTILHVDGKIYVFRGAGTQDFWMYDVGTGEWATLGQPPYTINTVNASAYDGTDYIYVARGTNQRHIMRYSISGKSWATMTTLYPIAINEQTTMEYRDGNLFIAQPNSTNLYKCEINDLACTGDTWSALKTLPATYRYGASIYHAKDGYLYIFRGNSTYDFWKYNIAENRYVGLDVFPQSFTTGGDLIWDGATHLYGFKGGAATSGFYYYDLTNGGWTSRSVTNLIGLSTDNKYVKAGNLIYVISGANFRSYDTTNDSGNWITLTSPPASFNTGSSLVYPGSGDYIYGIQGGSSNFYTYHITNGNWTTLDPANPPSIAANVGARVVTDGTSIFFNPGYGNTRFYKYDIGDDQWSEVAPIPSGAYSGADMSYYNGKVYTLTGTYRNHFFSYDIADNRWDHLETFQLREFTDKGSWSGASIEYIGDNTFAIAPGTGQDIYTYAVGSDEYENEAIYESQSIDLTYVTSWQNIVVDSEEEEGTSVKVETQSSLDGSSWTGYEEIVGDEIQSDPGRYIQTKITLSSNETHDKTPTVHAYTINYTPDDVKPNNPSAESFVGKSAVDGETISSGQTHNHLHPEFSWDPGTDNESGISGYYVYFGPNSEANPEEVGSFQAETSYEVNSAISTGDNFLLIKTKDVKGNVSDTVTLGFTYKFNGVSPSSPTTIATSNDFNAGNLDKITVANDSISLTHRNGFWNQTSLTAPTAAFGAGAGVVYKPSTNKLYAIRGRNSSNFWSYNIESNSWETLSSTNLPTINYGGGLVDGPGNYIYAWRGTVTNSFYRYDITDNDAGWSDADAADVPAAVSYGGSMVYDGNRYIYALKGVGDTFYRFDTQAEGGGEWTTLEVVDFGSQVPNNKVTDGGRIAFDGNDTIYATLGGSNAGGFAKYSILDKTWTPLGCLPDAPATGADISWDSASGSLYYINAYVRGEIYKYNPATAKWTTLTAAPTTFTTGTKMAKVDDYFYVSRGGGAGLYRYHTIKNSWEVPTFNLFGPNVYGTTNFTTGFGSTVLQGNSNYLYLSRGNFDDSFIRYDYVTGESLQLARLPVGAYQGADLTYDEDRGDIYYITGNNTTATLHKYSITTDTWSEVTTDVPPITPGYGSSLAYDGSQYIYYVRGNNSTSWYRYDINANAGSRWSGILPTANLAGIGHGSKLAIYDGYAYALRGQSVNPNPFYRFRLSDLPDGSWEVLSPLPNLVSYDGFLIAGNNGKLYAHRASNYQEFYEYDINAENWTEIEKSPAKFYQGSAGGGNKTNQIFAVSGNGTGAYQDGLYSFVYQTDSSAYEEEGSYTSQDFDLTAVYDWANITLSMVEASNTSLKIETQSSADAVTWSNLSEATGEKNVGSSYEYKITSPAARYLRVKISATSGDGIYSPTVSDYKINYYQDITDPSNPNSLSQAKSSVEDRNDLTDNNWYKHTAPYFAWPETEEENAASDENGSGVAGYYVYFGNNNSADPSMTPGIANELGETSKHYQTDNDLLIGTDTTTLTDGTTYYLIVKTKDNAGNIADSGQLLFTYKFDSSSPENPSPINCVISNNKTQTTCSWAGAGEEGGASDPDPDEDDENIFASGVGGYNYKTSASSGDYSNYLNEIITENEIVLDNSKLPAGSLTFYLKTVDSAGNEATPSEVSISNPSGAPTNIISYPETNESSPSEDNNFRFTWSPPENMQGEIKQYRYTINTPPTAINTANQITADSELNWDEWATQQGKNTIYIVAEGDWGGSNINYNAYASADFYIQTTAPDPPTELAISDSSNRVSEDFRLTVTWEAPAESDDVSSYIVKRSTDNTTFSQIGTTSSTGYLDSDLNSDTTYYYKIFSRDSAGGLSSDQGESGTISRRPTGKYSSPPEIYTSTISTVTSANSATIKWVTDRSSDSFVVYGTSEALGSTFGTRESTTEHKVEITGLAPGTKYYFKVQSLDPGDFRNYSESEGYSEMHELATAASPTISNVRFSDATTTSTILGFETNKPATTKIEYGTTTDYGKEIENTTTGATQHLIRLSDLQEGTTYQVKITFTDEEGTVISSPGHAFTTLEMPAVQSFNVETINDRASTTVKVSFLTNVDATGAVIYGKDTSSGNEVSTSEYKRVHEFEIADLEDSQTYVFQAVARDQFGNEAKSESNSYTTPVDSRPPNISDITMETSNVGTGKVDEAQIAVSWKTDELATSYIEYGKGISGEKYSNKSTEDPTQTNSHLVIVSGLSESTPYHLRACSKDKGNNVTCSEDNTIIPGEVTKSILSILLDALKNAFGWLEILVK